MDRSERIGLGFSAVGHGALLAALSLGLLHWSTSKPFKPPAIEVSLADDIALESRATVQADPQSAQAPELGEPEPETAEPPSQQVAEPEPVPAPRPAPPPPPQAKPKPAEQRVKPEPAKVPPPPSKSAPAKPEPAKATPAKPTAKPAEKPAPRRGPRLGDDFLKGLDAPATQKPSAAPGASQAPVSAIAARALGAEVKRQIKPYWKAPTGADAELLVSIVAADLNSDGSLKGPPRIVRQTGITASNSGQRQLHAENALRAVRLAAPFKLPPELFDAWQSLEIKFDKDTAR